MTTVASRLNQITGLTGATLAQHLMAMAAGSTVAAVLGAWSGLTGATMAQHLMADGGVQTEEEADAVFRGFGPIPLKKPHQKRRLEEEAAMLCGMC